MMTTGRRSDVLGFVRENVLNVSELTRTKKLSEILDKYSGVQSDEFYVIQNSRNKESYAVISDLEFFEELLTYKEAVDVAIDDIMYEVTLERQHDEATIPLDQVIDAFGLDVDKIIALSETIEEDE